MHYEHYENFLSLLRKNSVTISAFSYFLNLKIFKIPNDIKMYLSSVWRGLFDQLVNLFTSRVNPLRLFVVQDKRVPGNKTFIKIYLRCHSNNTSHFLALNCDMICKECLFKLNSALSNNIF